MKIVLSLSIAFLFLACGSENEPEQEIDEGSIPTEDSIELIDKEGEVISEIENAPCDYNFLEVLDNEFNQTAKVKAIGVFDSTWVVGEESVYGYNVKLWKVNSTVLGFMNHYYGSPEPYQSGPIVQGNLTEEKNLTFSAYLKLSKGYSNWSDSDPKILTFDGIYTKELLSGSLANYNCVTKESDIDMARTLGLMKSDVWGDLEEFENIQAWKKAFEYELNMNP